MTTTYLVDAGQGTHQIEAHTESEALAIAVRYRGDHGWRVVGLVPPAAPNVLPVYHPDMIGQRDPLEGEA